MAVAEVKNRKTRHKSPNGYGHVHYDKAKGYWFAQITKGYGADGKQLYKYFAAKTEKEILKKRDDFIALRNRGICIDATSITVGEWLDYWYKNYVLNNAKITTWVSDESIIRNYLKPHLGRIKLQDLKGYQIQMIYNELIKSGSVKKNKNNKNKSLSPKTVKNIHVVLHKALRQAVKNEFLIKNPLESVSLPQMPKKEIEVLTPDEQKTLVEHCSTLEHPWFMGILLALYSGMRRGELLGLTYRDLNFERNCITINKQVNRLRDFNTDAPLKTKLYLRSETKTKRSKRIIAISPVIMEKLKEYKKLQDKQKQDWKEAYNDLNMVFCRADGNLVDPDTFRDFYRKTLKKLNIEEKTFHALRHTFATRALESGANYKVVSEILGHASVQITLDTYSHVSFDLQQEAMQKITDSFF